MPKLNIKNKKILFLGYGAVAKCVWNYFNAYFVFSRQNVFLVDRTKNAFYGPNLRSVKKIVMNVETTNFEDLMEEIGFEKGDVIIDLSTSTPTYYFIKMCFIKGYHYINTSIEDTSDKMLGKSIDSQQQTLAEIAGLFEKKDSNILTECGQNPGLIQHYVLYALNEIRKRKSSNKKDDFRQKTMRKVISDYKIGTILMSEIDNMRLKKDTRNMDDVLIYNTWSVNGYIFESIDNTELVRGVSNHYVQPVIPKECMNELLMKIYSVPEKKPKREVIFLNKNALQTSLNSICPILNKRGEMEFTNYRGKLIHHGEVFELARYLGENAPFMSYVYKNSPYMDESIENFFRHYPNSTEDDLWLYVSQVDTFRVFDNMRGDKMVGHDSIGCTIFCGEKEVEEIFWCGSILSDRDDNVDEEFTPTIVQVAAGVLSGLSYILEPNNKNMGWVEPTDLDTLYMLKKSVPLLGKFSFLEIPIDEFTGKIVYQES